MGLEESVPIAYNLQPSRADSRFTHRPTALNSLARALRAWWWVGLFLSDPEMEFLTATYSATF